MRLSRRAFTLVELLVVIAIVLILIGLLLPALVKARQSCNFIICQSNLGAIGAGLNMYTSQYGFYPGGWVNVPNQGRAAAIWPTRLRPFVGNRHRTFYC